MTIAERVRLSALAAKERPLLAAVAVREHTVAAVERVAEAEAVERGGVGDLGEAGAGHLEDADLVGRAEAVLDRAQDAKLVAALALEIEHGVDHVLDDAGAGDLALLGDMADKDDGGAAPLGEGDQLMRAGADLRDGTGRGLDLVGPERLDRIDDGDIRALGVERGQDVAQRRLGAQPHRRIAKAKALRAHADLGAGFLARDVDGLLAGPREGGCGLQQQRRFADAGIAADKDRRSGHEATAQHAVQFGNARFGAGGRGLLRRKARQRHRLALEGAKAAARALRKRRFLDDRVPGAAGIAAPRPFLVDCAAGSAGECAGDLAHGSFCPRGSGQASGMGRVSISGPTGLEGGHEPEIFLPS